MKLTIVIVNYNTRKLLEKCLFSIYKSVIDLEKRFTYEIIVVDNGSKDGSTQMIRRKFPNVILLENRKNKGFAKANNQAIEKAAGKFILFLNSDTEIKGKSLEQLVDRIEKDEKIAVVGPKLLNTNGSFQPSVGFSPSISRVFLWMTFLDDILPFGKIVQPYHVEKEEFYKTEQFVDWISAACMLARKKILQAVGFFDEKIFMYGEEVELCYRIKKRGYKVVYIPEARVLHHKGASAKNADAGLLEEFEFLKFYYKKYKSLWQLLLLNMLLSFGALLRYFVFGIILKQSKKAKVYAKYLTMARR